MGFAGEREEEHTGSTNTPQQHNGIHTDGNDGDSAVLGDSSVHEQRLLQHEGSAPGWRQPKATGVQVPDTHSLLHLLLLLVRAVDPVHQPRQLPGQHSAPGAMAIRISPEYVAKVLARGCNFFTAGTRGFYFALPLLLWLFSPIAVLCSCVVLVPVLYYLDASDLDSDDEFLRKNSLTTQRISMAPPRPLNGAGPVFRACHELRKPAADGDMLLTACSDHWSNSDMRIRATQELVR